MMTDRILGFGIIGCGLIANWHIQAIEASGRAKIVGAADARIESSARFCEKYNIKQFQSVEEMLASDEIDIVSICTPSGFHAKYAIMAAEAGKNVLVEKPMALNIDDCDRIIEAANKYNVKIGVVSQFRFSRTTEILKSLIQNERLGKVVTADLFMKYYRSQEYYDSGKWRGTWELDGGGALMNQGVHGIDTLLSIMGPVKSVYGLTRTLARNIEVEDTASAVLEYQSGALGIIQGTTSVYPGYPRKISISGTQGTVSISEDIFVEWDIENEEIPSDIKLGGELISSAHDPKNIDCHGHKLQINDMIDSVLLDQSPKVDCVEGRRAVELICAIYTSSKTGKMCILS